MFALSARRSLQRMLSGSVSSRNLLASTALGCALALPGHAYAQNLPTGGSVAAGSVAIAQPSATQLNVTQSSQSAVVNWQGFSIGQGSSVNIAQPNASSAILNRVTGNTPSSIAGSLTGNGQVYLVNPNGIAITSTGTVNTSGFVASTLGISDSDFMNGKRTFTGNGASARVSNAGVITIGRGGYAALIGGTVSNSGSISVPLGKVGLGSGEQATLDFSGDGFLQVAMPTAAGGRGALIRNSGSIKANGGSIIISAATAREAARNAINISGLVQARSIGGHSGSIIIGGGAGGRVRITGRLVANSRHYAGGNITVTGKNIKLKGATVDASGATGGGTINIGGGFQGTGSLQHADTTTIDASTTIKADATQSGNGGNVVVWSDLLTTFAGTISARGGALGGDGGRVETSSAGQLHVADTARVYTLAGRGAAGDWLLDPQDFTIAASGGDMTGATLSTNLAGGSITILSSSGARAGSGDIFVDDAVGWSTGSQLTLTATNAIAVNANIAITGGGQLSLNTGTTQIDGQTLPNLSFAQGASVSFAETSPGSGIGIAGQALSINTTSFTLLYSMGGVAGLNGGSGNDALALSLTPQTSYGGAVVGTFGGTLEGLGHTINDLTITGSNTNVGLIGTLTGTVRDVGLVGGSVSGQLYVGDLVGTSAEGTIVQSYASGAVSGQDDVGGLVGQNFYGTIIRSYATGSVSGLVAGGLVGENSGDGVSLGTITESYATGAVTGQFAGGLVGQNYGGTISQSYATGPVTGSAAGGLVSLNSGPTTDSYWDTETSGQSSSAGGTGLTTAQLQNGSATGLGAAFSGGTGGLYPYLTNFFPNGVQAVSGFAYKDAGGTAAASGAAGMVTVGVDANGALIGSATTGANGYYYVLTPAGTIASGTNLLATVPTNGSLSVNAASFTQASGNAVAADNLNLYGNTFSATTSAVLLSQLPSLAPLRTAALAAGSAGADAIVNASTGSGYLTTGASFTIDQALDTSNIFVVTTQANAPLVVAAPVTVESGASLGLLSGGALQINAPITALGAASVALAYDASNVTNFSFAQGAPLTFANSNGSAASSDQGGALAINGQAYTLLYSMADIDGIDGIAASVNAINTQAGGLSGRYALAGNLDATGILYTDALVGSYATQSSATAFTGTFEGLGHTITGLTIAKAGDYAGLFGAIGSGATVRDVGLVGGSVSGQLYVGGLAGASIEGTIVQSYASGAVSASQDYAGGLVGYNFYATIIRSYATGSVAGYAAGGLVGYNFGDGVSLGTIIESYATGAVTGQFVGGLVGQNAGTISRSYATGPVTGSDAGGLVGFNTGLATDSYWDTETSGQPSSSGGTGLTTALLQNGSATGLGAAFSGGTGGLYPYLTNFFPNGVQAVTGTALLSGGTAASGAQVGVYSGGTLLTGVTTSAGANGYFYEIVAAGTLAGNAKFGATLTLAGAGSVSGLLYTDAAASSGSVFALGTLNDSLNRQITADTTYSALQTDLGAAFGTTRYATLATTLNATPTSITASGASFTLDLAVKVAADFSLSTTGTNAPLTLDANLSAARQTVTLTSTGSILQNSGTITADTLTGSSVGDASFTGAGNNIGALGTFSTTGGFVLIDAASLSVAGAVNAEGTVLISATRGNLDITTGSVTSSATSDAVTLATAGDFINGAGASAVQAANGRWLIYSTSPTADSFGNLDSGNTAVWNATYAALPPGSVAAAGDRYLFAFQPTLTFTSTGALTKTYGQDATAAVTASYTVTGLQAGIANAFLGDTDSTVFSGTPTLTSQGAPTSANASTTPYGITINLSGLTSLNNYAFAAVNNGNLTVTPANIVVTALGGTSVYGSSPANPGLSAAGLQNGESVGVLTGLSNSFGITGTSGVAGSPYTLSVLGKLGNQNYNVTSTVNGSWSVTPANIVVTALGGTSVYGSSPANPGLSATGLQNGESVGVLTGLSNSFGITGTSGVAGGPYTLSVLGILNNPNYTVSERNGSWTVTPASVSVTALGGTSVYGTLPADPGFTATGLENGESVGVLTGLFNSFGITNTSTVAGSPYTLNVAGTLTNQNYVVTARNDGVWTVTAPIANIPFIVAGPQYQPPRPTNINFVTSSNAPGALVGFTRPAPVTRTAANPDDLTTGALGRSFAKSPDGLFYVPISEYDATQYANGKLPADPDHASLATILTMIARAVDHDHPPTIDQFFDPAKGADWHGVGWQNPIAGKVAFAPAPHAQDPAVANALAFEASTDLGELLGHGLVILAGTGGSVRLLATVRTEDGIVANDPATGLRVLLSYNPETRAIGPISRILDPGGTKWMVLSDAAKADIAAIDDAKVAILKAFVAEKYLTVTLVK